jgi:hypothetical protein
LYCTFPFRKGSLDNIIIEIVTAVKMFNGTFLGCYLKRFIVMAQGFGTCTIKHFFTAGTISIMSFSMESLLKGKAQYS